jgi:hypothetical protein
MKIEETRRANAEASTVEKLYHATENGPAGVTTYDSGRFFEREALATLRHERLFSFALCARMGQRRRPSAGRPSGGTVMLRKLGSFVFAAVLGLSLAPGASAQTSVPTR